MDYPVSIAAKKNFPLGGAANLLGGSHDDPMTGLKETLKELSLDYVDLYLIHWPMGARNTFDHVPVSNRGYLQLSY